MIKKVLKIIGLTVGVLILFIIMTALWLLKDGFRPMVSTPYLTPPQTDKTWDDIFAKPVDISVTPLKTGIALGDRYTVMNSDDPKIKFVKNRYEPSDVLAFWVDHKELGDFLIDAGYNRSFSTNPPYGNYSPLLVILLRILDAKPVQEEGQNIASLLIAHQVAVKKVFFTHLHGDHTGGVPELPDDIEYIYDKNEVAFLAKALLGNHFESKTKLKTLDFDTAKSIPPFEAVIDIFGDGSLWAISTPGHSPGHISYLVNTKTEPILITGDAAAYMSQFQHGIEPVGFDSELALQSLLTLRSFVKQYPQVKIFVGHELIQY